jgi:hypothetical protein
LASASNKVAATLVVGKFEIRTGPGQVTSVIRQVPELGLPRNRLENVRHPADELRGTSGPDDFAL